MNTENNYPQPSEEDLKKQLQEALIKKIHSDFQVENVGLGLKRYTGYFQNTVFTVELYDDELARIPALAMEIIEELENVNQSGVDAAYVAKLKEEVHGEYPALHDSWCIPYWNKLSNLRLKELISEADELCRVGGSYAFLVANPVLISTICAIYDRLVDNFDDLEIYIRSLYFLTRGLMKMHGDEVNE